MGINIIISKNKKYYYLEGFNLKKKDSFNKKIKIKKVEVSKTELEERKKLCEKIKKIQSNILTRIKYYDKPKKNYFDNKQITKIYSIHNFFWDDLLINNILHHNIEISNIFKLFINYYPSKFYNPYKKQKTNKKWIISKKEKYIVLLKIKCLSLMH